MLHVLLGLVLLGLCVVLWEPIVFGIVMLLKFAFWFVVGAVIVTSLLYVVSVDKGFAGALIAIVGIPFLLYLGYKQA